MKDRLRGFFETYGQWLIAAFYVIGVIVAITRGDPVGGGTP